MYTNSILYCNGNCVNNVICVVIPLKIESLNSANRSLQQWMEKVKANGTQQIGPKLFDTK